MVDPRILLVSNDEIDVLTEQFHRYEREYDVRAARSAAKATLAHRYLEGLRVLPAP